MIQWVRYGSNNGMIQLFYDKNMELNNVDGIPLNAYLIRRRDFKEFAHDFTSRNTQDRIEGRNGTGVSQIQNKLDEWGRLKSKELIIISSS